MQPIDEIFDYIPGIRCERQFGWKLF